MDKTSRDIDMGDDSGGEDLAVIMEAYRREMLGTFTGMLEKQTNSVQRHIDKQLGKISCRVGGVEQKAAKQDPTINQVRQKQKEFEEQLKEHEKRVKHLEQLAAMPQPTPAELRGDKPAGDSEKNVHAVDRIILRANASNLVAKEAVEKIFADIADRTNIPHDSFEVLGWNLARRFTISFGGDFRTAARRAKRANDSLRNANGS